MSSLNSGLDLLKKIRRLDGVAIIRGGAYAYCDLALDDAGREEFKNQLIGMFQAYANEGRVPRKVVIGCASQCLMMLNERTIILVMIYANQAHTPFVEKSGELFLEQFAESLDLPTQPPAIGAPPIPEPTPTPVMPPPLASPGTGWLTFQSGLENLLTKVVASGQASTMIARQLADDGFSQENPPDSGQFREFGTSLLRQIRDRSIRSLLMMELEHLLGGRP